VDLLRGNRQLVTDLLWEKWSNGFWPELKHNNNGVNNVAAYV